ncbi:MAG: TSUP family transporter [Clostridia bacterium]|nr:TSUP family transporter [Clostridia bacterium]
MATSGKTIRKAACGGAVGAANGLFGGGGGMIAVPLLTGLLGYREKTAHATAIIIIAPVSFVSAIVYWIAGFADLSVIIPSALGMAAGGALGAMLLDKLPLTAVKLIFIAVMLAAGIRMML